MNKLYRFCYGMFVIFISIPLAAQPLFDTHLHYSQEDAQHFNPQKIIELLDKNVISYAAVTGTPPQYVSNLYHQSPDRVIPLLSVYRHKTDKSTWTKDKTLIPYLKNELKKGHWRGIGELHIFSPDRHSNVFQQVIALASKWQLPLLIHCDPAVIDSLYEIAPTLQVIWAHAGTFPYPDLVANYLERYPNLLIDVSMRDERIAPKGIINDEWYEIFVTYPKRFMIGVDTYSTTRWYKYNSATAIVRNWLTQLPDEIAQQIAFINAATLYRKPHTLRDE